MNSYSSYQFAFFRIILGLYLVAILVYLLPYAPDLLSSSSVVSPGPNLSIIYYNFPNLLTWFDSRGHLELYFYLMIVCAFFFAMGLFRRTLAVVLWYLWACIFNRNPLMNNPAISSVGWLLLASAIVPSGEGLSFFKKKDPNWRMPKPLYICAWLVMATSYSFSGITKLSSETWLS
ncbi:MAG: hypothetical protein KDD53_07365, partial [Bdellovibrionales bacterium]|nr:hypothetical protein [Bdellovibrionales bacterium]